MTEMTFVGHLGNITSVRADRRRQAGDAVLIASGAVEERQIDPATGRLLRCDIRLNAPNGRKLASGEVKRPEVPEGRDPRNEILRADARKKAVARGLPYYFTCNMAEVVLYAVAQRAGEQDKEEVAYILAPISDSKDVAAFHDQIEAEWTAFLNDLEDRLRAVETARPSVTTRDVLLLRDALDAIADEAIERSVRRVAADDSLAERIREEAFAAFGFNVNLNRKFPHDLRHEMLQIIRLCAFVLAQKLILYRVLAEAGPRRQHPFSLDAAPAVGATTDPAVIRGQINAAVGHAIKRSKDYETAFNPQPLEEAVFVEPETQEEVDQCRVGEVWEALLQSISTVSWAAISQNLVGFLYETIVDPEFRHQLGQHYTREDVVDVLVTYAIERPGELVLDPASGGGSFVRAAYARKRALGDTHEEVLRDIWAFEIAAFAAELTTISLATADTSEPAAYPRVLLRDFFTVAPRDTTELQVPDDDGTLSVPELFDAVIGNPPYISYRNQTNQDAVVRALTKDAQELDLPAFSGKSDEYVWFLVHATRFLRAGGRLAFVVSSGILFSDYGIPLIRFLGRHFRIEAVIDSVVERWFIDADTNTVLLLLRREPRAEERATNTIRFVRLRRPLAQLLPTPEDPKRRQALETLVEEIASAPAGDDDPRFQVNMVAQGSDGGLDFAGNGFSSNEDDDE
jgi:type I restriction-modification system DNA methylase subunit